MPSTTTQGPPPALNAVGFLTIVQEACGYIGGYLVTNRWGRPLEFRLTSAVQPNRAQQVLYGPTLISYVCADLIGKTLFDKTSVASQLLIADREEALDLRLRVEVPVVWLAAQDDARAQALASSGCPAFAMAKRPGLVLCHPGHLSDAPLVRDHLQRLEDLDLAEPLSRAREAIAEARKMGVAR